LAAKIAVAGKPGRIRRDGDDRPGMSNRLTGQTRRKNPREIFFVPGVIAVITCGGLLAALLGDGFWDAASWVTLSVPLAVVLRCLWLRRR
jgi:hypothetical protein